MREVTLLMCLFSLLGLAVIRPQGLEASVVYVTSGVFVVISFLVLWQFWNGRNWARWLVLAYSALSLPNLFLLSSVPTVAKFLLAAEAALGVWLLFWLNTAPVRAFFRSRGESAAA